MEMKTSFRKTQQHTLDSNSPESAETAKLSHDTKHSTESPISQATDKSFDSPASCKLEVTPSKKQQIVDVSPLQMCISLPSTSDPTPPFTPAKHVKLPASKQHLENIILVDANVDAECIKTVLADLPPGSTNVAPVCNQERSLHYVYCNPHVVCTVCEVLDKANLPCVTYPNWYVCVMTQVATGDVRALMNSDFKCELRPYVRICEYDKHGPSAHIGKPSDRLCMEYTKLYRVLVAKKNNSEKLVQKMVTADHTFEGPFSFYEASGNQLSSLHEALVMTTPRYVREYREAQYHAQYLAAQDEAQLENAQQNVSLPNVWMKADAETANLHATKAWPDDGGDASATRDTLYEVAAQGQDYDAVAQAHAHASVVQARAIQAYAEAYRQAQHGTGEHDEWEEYGNTMAYGSQAWPLTSWPHTAWPVQDRYFCDSWHTKDGMNKRNPNHPIPPAESGVKGKKGERVDAGSHPNFREMQTHTKHKGTAAKGQERWDGKAGKGDSDGKGYERHDDTARSFSRVYSYTDWNSARKGSDWNAWNIGSWAKSPDESTWHWPGNDWTLHTLSQWPSDEKDSSKGKAWKGRKTNQSKGMLWDLPDSPWEGVPSSELGSDESVQGRPTSTIVSCNVGCLLQILPQGLAKIDFLMELSGES